jgi:chromosome segregation ATPase
MQAVFTPHFVMVSTEAVQALYGVTMQELGVSKLVSMKFEPAMAN